MPSKYMQLADLLRGKIASLRGSGETKLPTEDEMCTLYSVSRQTVRNALTVLLNEGLIEKRQGSGTYIKARVRQQDARQIALVTTFIDDYIFPAILHEVQVFFEKHDYSTLVYATGNRTEREREILTSLLDKSVSAILIEGSKTALPSANADLFMQFQQMGVPVLFLHGSYSNLPSFPSVLDDNVGGGRMLAEYLIGSGKKRLAGIFKGDDMQGPERYLGMCQAMVEAGLEVKDGSFFWYDSHDRELITGGRRTEHFEDAITYICEKADGVVCYNDEIAYSLIQRLAKLGKKIPEDVAVASFDNSFFSQIGAVPITSLGHIKMNTGRNAAQLLLKLIEGGEAESIRLKWDLVARSSG